MSLEFMLKTNPVATFVDSVLTIFAVNCSNKLTAIHKLNMSPLELLDIDIKLSRYICMKSSTRFASSLTVLLISFLIYLFHLLRRTRTPSRRVTLSERLIEKEICHALRLKDLRKKGPKGLRLIFKSRTEVGYDMKMPYNSLYYLTLLRRFANVVHSPRYMVYIKTIFKKPTVSIHIHNTFKFIYVYHCLINYTGRTNIESC